ncbi:MAG: hypothetical protein ABIU87_02335 [Ornithinibacter sp.]
MDDDQPEADQDRPEPDPTTRSPYSPYGTPAPLAAAAGLTLVEGFLTGAFGLAEAANLDSDRLVMGLSTALFFAAYGVVLLVCAWGMNTVRAWSRGPVLLSQLIWLGLAWNFRSGDTLPVAIALAVVAALVLAGLLHPRSIDALERSSNRD